VLAAGLDPAADAHLFREEAFGPVLAETALPGRNPAAFLEEAAAFANGRLAGNLGATLLVHPRTAAELGEAGLRRAIGALRYGAVGVNGWVAMAFALTEVTWGAYPEPGELGSGRGHVHDAYGVPGAERSVTFAPFQPFPRSLARGRLELMPTPPWFLRHPRAGELCRRLARFAASPGLRHVPGLVRAGYLP
jgi:hypothetical protein